MIPILGTASGAHIGGARVLTDKVIGTIRSPDHLNGFSGLYVLYVEGESMAPQFSSGDPIVINPNKPARIGDVVVVRMRGQGGADEATLGVYLRRDDGDIVIGKHNPHGSEVRLPGQMVLSVEKVLSPAELIGA